MTDPSRPGEAPPPDISALILLLTGLAMEHLSQGGNQEEGRESDLLMARHFIDLLGVLEEKTAGNLEAAEETLLRGLLDDLRLRFIRASEGEEGEIEGEGE